MLSRILLPLALAAIVVPACERTPPAPPGATLSIGELLGGSDTLHARAFEPRTFTFPEDHGPHPEFRTEWWYFTGSLTAEDGRELGYQLTFFRNALSDSASFVRHLTGPGGESAPPAGSPPRLSLDSADTRGSDASPWRARHAYMAHFAVTDAGARSFHAEEKFARGAADLAGVRTTPLRVWLEGWSVASAGSETFPLRLHAAGADIAIDLTVDRGKPIVLQGERGLSRKGPEPGNASYYYSLTRMPTLGTIRTPSGTHVVNGSSWLDREWSTSVLSAGVTGWDWLSLQLSDSTELMMYRLRRDDDTVDPFSAATFIARDGTSTGFDASGYTMLPMRTWRSRDGAAYPVAWRIAIPSLALELDVAAVIDEQELDLAVRYWEGMVSARGNKGGDTIGGRGYLEMTGYAGEPRPAR